MLVTASKLVASIAAGFLLLMGMCEVVPESEPIDESDLPGTYQANFGAGKIDLLWLRPNSVWVRFYVSWSDEIFVDSGKYSLEYSWPGNDKRHRRLRLNDFKSRFSSDSSDWLGPMGGQSGLDGSTSALRFADVSKRTGRNDTTIYIGYEFHDNWTKMKWEKHDKSSVK